MRSLLVEFTKNDRLIANMYLEDKGYLLEALNLVKGMLDNYNKNLSNLDKSLLDADDIIFAIFFLKRELEPKLLYKDVPLMRESSIYKLLNLDSKYIFDKDYIATSGGVIAIEKEDIGENFKKGESAILINFDSKRISLHELVNLYDRKFYEGMNNSARFKTCDFSCCFSFNEIEELIEINNSYKGWKTSTIIYEAITRK